MSKKRKTKPGAFSVTLTFNPMEGLGGGFRQEWASAKCSDFKAGIDSGAGLGNPLMTFWFERNGKRQYFTADINAVMAAGIDACTDD